MSILEESVVIRERLHGYGEVVVGCVDISILYRQSRTLAPLFSSVGETRYLTSES